MTDEVRELITRRAPEHEIRKAARAAGMQTLAEDGIAKAAQGLTTLEAILKIVSPDDGAPVKGEGTDAAISSVSSPAPEPEDEVSTASEPSQAAGGKEKGRVLIVEDSKTIASVVKYYLELEGFEVLLAQNGLIGLETAKRELPQVIVTDVNMPGMDGVAMVRALRADESTRDISILMLTSESSVESETQGLDAGANDYILKPVEPRRLASRVKALMARSQGKQLANSR